MHPRAIDKAKSRLRLAKKAIEDLPNCKNMESFNDTWFSFLFAFKSVYTTLEQGSKTSPQSRQWFGSKGTERKRDPLLQYLYQARDDDEHGLDPIVERVSGSLGIGVAAPGFSKRMRFDGTIGPGGTLKATSLDGKPVLTQLTLPHVALGIVTGRGNVKYQPPTSHLGQPLSSNLPLPVAQLGLTYVERLVAEAEQRSA